MNLFIGSHKRESLLFGPEEVNAMKKTLTFGLMHFSIAFLVVWALTGDWMVGGAVALIEPAINTIGYFFHEKAWAHADARACDPRREESLAA